MADKDKYQGFIRDDDSLEDSFTGLLYDLFDVNIASGYLGGNFNSYSYDDFMKWAFISFKKTCRETYESMIGKEDQAYYYFRDTLNEYQLLKEKFFYEKENQLYHILVNKPVSKEGDNAQRTVYVAHKYLNQTIFILEDYVKRLSADNPSFKKSNLPDPDKKIKIHGFNVKNQDCLDDAYNQLVEYKIIAEDVLIHDFKTAFLGRIPENKIRWLQGPGLLAYFIKEINGIGILDTKKHIWDSTIACFVDKDRTPFEKTQLRHGKIPKSRDEIKMVIYTFNENPYNDI